MVTSITSFSTSSYLDSIKGVKPAPAANTQPAETVSKSSSSEDLVTLLNSVSSASDKGYLIADIIGSASTASSDPLAGLYSTFLFNKTSTSPLQQAIFSAKQFAFDAKATSSSNTTQKALASYHSGINAYNKVLQENAQAVLNAGQSLII